MEPQNQFLSLFKSIITSTNKYSAKILFSRTQCSVSHSIQKRFHLSLIIFLAFFSVSVSTFGQTTYHWRASAGSGAWTNPANWSTAGRLGAAAANSPGILNTDIAVFDGISGVVVAVDQDLNIGKLNFINNSNITLQPSGGSRSLVIRTNAADAFSIGSNSTLDLSGNAGGDNLTLTFIGGVVTGQSIDGYFRVSSALGGGNGTFDRNNTPITFGAASTYEHARDAGAIPQATWDPSSTLYVTGIETSGFTPFLTDQSFGNLIWDCPLQDDLQVLIGNVSNVTITIKGNMNIVNSGFEFLMLIDANRPANIQVEGDVILGDGVNDARFYLNGGTQNTVLNVGGDLIVNLNARFELQNGTATVNFGIAGLAGNTIWGGSGTFGNDDISYVIRNLPAGKTVTLNGFASNILLLAHGSSVTINSGATLNCGIQVIGGTGGFTLEAGGTIGLGHPNGLDGNVTANGIINFNSTGAGTTFIYNGTTSNQITGTTLPAAVTNLRIQNTFPNSIITLSNATTVNGILTMISGVLSIGANDIFLPAGASLAGNLPGSTNMVATGTGKFFKHFQTGDTPAFTFPIGELTGRDYTPVVLDFSDNISAGLVGIGVTDANHPSIANGGTPTGYLSRYWSVEASGLTDYTYNVSTYTYTGADVNGSEAEMKLSFWNGSIWTPADNSSAAMNILAILSPLNNITGTLDGNAFTGRSRVCIGDIVIPTITCPPDLSQDVAAGSCTASVTVPDAVFFDNCTVPILTWELTGATTAIGSGQMGNYLFNSGVTNVRFTATDGSGNTAFCTFTVTVNDIIIPAIICPANINVSSNPALCGAVVAYATPIGTDNCPGAVTVQIAGLPSGSLLPLGSTTNTFRVTDVAGNTTTCSFIVTVTDNVVPVVVCKDFNLYLDGTGNAILSANDINNGSTDNCPGLSFFVSKINFSCADLGAPVAVILTGTDATGNSATCNSLVTVVDTVRPTVNVKTFDLVIGASGTSTLLPSDVDNGSFDNCGPVILSVLPNTFSCGDQGSQTVILTAIDSYGNSRSRPVDITVSSSLSIDALSLSTCDLAAPYALYSSSVSGGNGTYSYFWDGLEDNADPFVYFDLILPFLHFTNTSAIATPFFNNLMPDGIYNIKLVVTDGNGCVDSSAFVLNKGGMVYNNINVRYSDACEGGTEIYSVPPDPTATYSWNVVNGTIQGPSNTSSVQVLWNMGVLNGVVIGNTSKPDLLGDPCEWSVVDSVSIHSVVVPQFDNPVLDVCSNSVVTYTLTNTYATYSWIINGGVIINGGTINDNFATVRWGAGTAGRVTASAGISVTCTGSTFVDVSIFNLLGSITSQTNVSCNGASDGSVTAVATAGSGQPPYEYSLDGGPYSLVGTFSGIATGNHFVRIRDFLMCSIDLPFTITQPLLLLGSVASQTNVSCFGGSNGSVTISASGGMAPYQYNIDGGSYQGSNTFNGLAAGAHTVIIRDAGSCTSNVNFNISEPTALNGTITSQTNVDCFGNSTGSVSVAGSGGASPYTYRLDAGAYQAAGNFNGLPAGSYSVTVRNANLCTFNVPVIITQPGVLTGAIASLTNAACFGESTGQVTMAAGGGTSPYQYRINAGSYQVSPTFMGLAAGSYIVTIRDARMCIVVVPVSIMEPGVLVASASSNSPVCQGTPLNLFGGPAGMSLYSWTGPNGYISASQNPNISLSATPAMNGVYNLAVTSPAGCTASANVNVTVTPFNTVNLTSLAATENQSVCSNSPISNITYSTIGATGVNVTNLPSGVTGSWAAGIVTISGTPVISGTFSYTVILTGGCGIITETGTITVDSFSSISLTSLPATENQAVCINSPVVDITYSTTGATGATVTGLPAGVTSTWAGNALIISGTPSVSGIFGYTVNLTGGCGAVTESGTVTVNPDNTITLTSLPATENQATCINTQIADITYSTAGATGANVTGIPAGVAGNWSGNTVTISGTPTVSGVFGYTVNLTGGCGIVTSSGSILVNALPSVIITNPVPSCSPADLTAAAVTAGSTPGLNFTYWTDAAATTPYATPAAATNGTYYIKGSDPGTGCYSIQPVIANVNELPVVTLLQTNVLCFGAATGAIDVTVTGGTGPYAYSWTGTGVVAGSEDQTGLIAGTYDITVTDANNCQPVMLTVIITQPATAVSGIIIAQTDVSLFGGNDGSVEVAGSGGIAPYQYKLGTGGYQASGVFTSLAGGSYTITVQDANLCTFDIPVTIIQPLSGGVFVTNVACFGNSTGSVDVTGLGGVIPYEYQMDGGAWQSSGIFGSLSTGNYTATVRDANMDTFDIPFTVSSPSAAVGGTIITQSDVLCFGGATGTVDVAGSGGTGPFRYSLDGGSFQALGTFSLQAGTHQVIIMDSNLCTFNIDVVIDEPASALAGAITSQTSVTCHGNANGSVAASASGGTAPYEYSLNGGAFQSSGTFGGLPGGSNTITVRDANLCTMLLPVSIAEPAELVLSAEVTDADCPGTNQGMIVLTITGGTLPYNVIWSDGITTTSRTNITDGDYAVVVIDGNGCNGGLSVTVGVIGTEGCVEIPVIITPNGDGYNDTWRIKNIDLFPDAEVIIFNRWGQRVFNTKNILANPWDGTLKGKPLPVDSYHYILDFHNGSKPRSGVISIIK